MNEVQGRSGRGTRESGVGPIEQPAPAATVRRPGAAEALLASLACGAFAMAFCAASAPAESPPVARPAPATRVISGNPQEIRITSRPNGQIQLYDGNDRTIYSTDAASSDRRLVRSSNGDLRYENEHGDTFVIHANDDVTTHLRSQAILIRSGSAPNGKRFTKSVTLPKVLIKDRQMEGTWIRAAPVSNRWTSSLSQNAFDGEIELLDSATGTYRITDASSRARKTFRRDRTQTLELFGDNNQTISASSRPPPTDAGSKAEPSTTRRSRNSGSSARKQGQSRSSIPTASSRNSSKSVSLPAGK